MNSPINMDGIMDKNKQIIDDMDDAIVTEYMGDIPRSIVLWESIRDRLIESHIALSNMAAYNVDRLKNTVNG